MNSLTCTFGQLYFYNIFLHVNLTLTLNRLLNISISPEATGALKGQTVFHHGIQSGEAAQGTATQPDTEQSNLQ